MTSSFSPFDDRTAAGERLAALLERRGVGADGVLAVPRGGLPVARVVADALDLPLDVVVARKLGAPTNPELAIGAVAADGSRWLNDALIDRLGVDEDYVERTAEREAENARRKRERYRGEAAPATIGGTVLVVDDGIATGATTIACVRQARRAGAERVIVAVPVAPPDVVESLREEADDVIAVMTPSSFGAVGRFYRSFDQVPDEAAMEYLESER